MKDSHVLDRQLAEAADAVMRAGILDELATRVINPYIIMAVILVALGLLLRFAHLPEVDTDAEEPSVGDSNVNKTSIWHFPHMLRRGCPLLLCRRGGHCRRHNNPVRTVVAALTCHLQSTSPRSQCLE
jgi:MFS transporter, FHS family, L-fucose permease